MLNKIGKHLLIGGLFVIVSLTVSSIWFEAFFESLPQVFFLMILLSSVIASCISPSFIYYNSEIKKRKKVITVLSITSSIVLLIGIFSKIMHWTGASAEAIISIFLFSFGCLPLIIKGRYENRKSLLSNVSIILNIIDLSAILCLCLGALFKFMHWAGWLFLTIPGFILLVTSIISWNVSFRKEVKLKLLAQDKLKQTLKNLEEKNKVIEEKQMEILDSIKYAKRIQNAHLPNEKFIAKTLKRLK